MTNSRTPFSSRKRKLQDVKVNELYRKLLAELSDVSKKINDNSVADPKEDSNALFCKSLIQSMEDLSEEQNMLARIKINQVLFEVKFGKKL